MVFQDYALFPHLTLTENVGFGLPRSERPTRVPMLLALVDLCGLGDRYPHELSGGQQQRVALARALAPAPEVILLDEPWSNIDPHLRDELRDELAAILRPLGVTVVIVTHDREEAFSIADRIALVRDGRSCRKARLRTSTCAPSRWAAEFVGAANFIPGTRRRRATCARCSARSRRRRPGCAGRVSSARSCWSSPRPGRGGRGDRHASSVATTSSIG